MKRILVVEDSPTQAEAARLILQSQKFEVHLASSGEEALQQIETTDFDLVISDIMMPGMNGYELCARIKGDHRRPRLPVILLTTLSDPMDIIEGLESGADNFITKPYEPEYLIHRVNNIVKTMSMRAAGKLKVGVEFMFLGKKFVITSEKEQILDLLIATFEDIVRKNQDLRATQAELSAAKEKIEEYARALEGRVQLSEEKYRQLMQRANDAILLMDADGTLLEANRKAQELFDRERDALVGCSIRDLAEIDPRVESLPGEISIIRDDGQVRAVEASSSLTEIGGETLALAILRDVTEKKQLERRIRDSEKLEAIGRLASGVAHDFNNILMVILTFSSILDRELQDGSERSRKAASEIRKAAKHGSWLTGQLLAFSRAREATRLATDVNAVLQSCSDILQQLAGERVSVRMTLDSSPAVVTIDAGQIQQIVSNLVANARDAMPDGGEIAIATSKTIVEGVPHLLLSVSDTGSGMDDQTRARIFEPFFTTKKASRGTGLGLAIIQTIVKDHQGGIEIDSAIGKGTTFRIHLPLEQNAEEQQRVVLLVTAESSLRSLVEAALSSRGHTVHGAADYRNAMDVMTGRVAPDLIITDLAVEDVSRMQEELRGDRSAIPALLISHEHGSRDAEPAAGPTAVLPTPFTTEDLSTAARMLLDKAGKTAAGAGNI